MIGCLGRVHPTLHFPTHLTILRWIFASQ